MIKLLQSQQVLVSLQYQMCCIMYLECCWQNVSSQIHEAWASNSSSNSYTIIWPCWRWKTKPCLLHVQKLWSVEGRLSSRSQITIHWRKTSRSWMPALMRNTLTSASTHCLLLVASGCSVTCAHPTYQQCNAPIYNSTLTEATSPWHI